MENEVPIKCEPLWEKEEEAVGYESIKEPDFVSCTEPKMELFEQDELMNDQVTSVLNIKEEVDVLEESGNELKSELEMEDHSISEHSYDEMDKDIDVEKLIQEVQYRPTIWDMTEEDYGDRIKRKKSWEEIVNLFVQETSTEEKKKTIGSLLQKKWKNIRDRYSREVRERKGTSGQASRKRPPYMYAQQLMFLSDSVMLRKTSSSKDSSLCGISHSDSERVGSPFQNEVIEEPQRKERQVVHSHQGEFVEKRERLNPVEAKLIQALDVNVSRQEQREKLVEDEDRLFLLSLLPSMKCIPGHLKLTARIDMMHCINRYTMYTPLIPPPPPPQQPHQQQQYQQQKPPQQQQYQQPLQQQQPHQQQQYQQQMQPHQQQQYQQ